MIRIPACVRLAALALLAACGSSPTAPSAPTPVRTTQTTGEMPDIRREFRGLWVATVANIDWPSRSGLSAAQQQQELVSILDRAVQAGMNAIVLQVRTASDALYRSDAYPWGSMLTGKQGQDPGYDPLEFAVREAHARGLELHAWFNPFRAGNASDSSRFATNHVFRSAPQLVRRYGTSLWLDPGEPDNRTRTLAAIVDVVRRYDIDAVHLDDYFYPYPQTSNGQTLDFPDSATFARYGSGQARADWRRSNVDRFVEQLYRDVHATKSWVRVGISPFGIWRPGTPAGITGLDAYNTIYADARKWLQSGWVDYLAPQLYWAIDPPQQSFTALLSWWQSQNTQSRFVWPGIATYRVYEGTTPYPVSEVTRQVQAARERSTNGMLFYNTTTTLSKNNGEIATAIQPMLSDPSLPPASTWLDSRAPARPVVTVTPMPRGYVTATIGEPDEPVRWWIVRYREGGRWTTQFIPGSERSLSLTSPTDATVTNVNIVAVDRVGNVSEAFTWSR